MPLPKDALEFRTHSIHETHISIQADALRHISKRENRPEVIILRVEGLRSPSGRPTTRTLRIPGHMLEEFKEADFTIAPID